MSGVFCCDSCFADKQLKHSIRRESTTPGICPVCKTDNASLVECNVLRDKFESLLEAYIVADGKEGEEGEDLDALLQRDWALFAVAPEGARSILVAILGKTSGQKYLSRAADGDIAITQWHALRTELKSHNRFFPTNAPNSAQLEFLSSLLTIDQTRIHTPLYRARIQKFELGFEAKDLKAPPADLVGNGRANPIGIPYLYVASDIATAVAEVRPSKGDTVYVANFTLTDALKIVDLTNPRSTISPFAIEPEQLPEVRSSMDFLCTLGDELSSPALPHRAQIDYLASQYLCELFKKFGFDGVRYTSSVGPGVNYAFFDTEALLIDDALVRVEVTEVSVTHRLMLEEKSPA